MYKVFSKVCKWNTTKSAYVYGDFTLSLIDHIIYFLKFLKKDELMGKCYVTPKTGNFPTQLELHKLFLQGNKVGDILASFDLVSKNESKPIDRDSLKSVVIEIGHNIYSSTFIESNQSNDNFVKNRLRHEIVKKNNIL